MSARAASHQRNVTGIPYAKQVRFALMYMIGLTLVWLIATFIPWLSLGLMPTPG